jgi:hypothetical protein
LCVSFSFSHFFYMSSILCTPYADNKPHDLFLF